jgi:competence protein ComEC
MNSWKQFPLLRLMFLFITGILAGLYFPGNVLVILPFLSIFFILFLLLVVFLKPYIGYKFRWLPGVFISVVMAGLGYEITLNSAPSDVLSTLPRNKSCYIADIVEPVTFKPGTAKAVLALEAVCAGGKWKKTGGKILVYFQKDCMAASLDYGNRVLFFALTKELPGPANPFSYDYRRYLLTKGILIQAYVKKGQWKIISTNEQNPLYSFALSLRKIMLDIFRNNRMEGREFAVGAALLLGYVDEIDPGLIKDYAATGAMHILSVSGMHVGIIFIVLEKLLAGLRRFRHGIVLKTGLVILLIWFYAALTGLSPAVLRAAAMLSLVAMGNSLQRSPDILNTLAASVMLLLICNPRYLADAGFQLSYLAVAGIILVNKPISNLFQPDYWIVDQVWAILAVSLAAQIATFPLSLYYFHQFPNYFMITNILVVPLSSLIIYVGIILLLFGSVPFISWCIARIMIFLIGFLNGSIHFIEQLPCSTLKGLVISEWELFFLYLFFIVAGLFIHAKKKSFLYASLAFLIILAGSGVMKKLERLEYKKMIVYSLRNGSAVEFIERGKSILAGNQVFELNDFSADIIQNARLAMGCREKLRMLIHPMVDNQKHVISGSFFRKGKYIQFNGRKIGIVNSILPVGPVTPRLDLDLIIIAGNPKVKIVDLLKIFSFREVVIDATNSAWRTQNWINEAKSLGIKCYSVAKSGAFVKDL